MNFALTATEMANAYIAIYRMHFDYNLVVKSYMHISKEGVSNSILVFKLP